MSQLLDHARSEMELAGLFSKDADYDGAIAPAVMKILRVFDEQGHSGSSAALTIGLLERLLRFENLTPLTSNPDEWMEVSRHALDPTWQSRRRSTTFSRDGGKTWYDIKNPGLDSGDTWKRDQAKPS